MNTATSDVPLCEPTGRKCHCGGVEVFRARFRDQAPRVECGSCGYERPDLPKLRETHGWIDAKFREDESQQAILAEAFKTGLLEHLDDGVMLAGKQKRDYDSIRYRLAQLVIDLRDNEIDDLYGEDWPGDLLNVAAKLRPMSEFGEFNHTFHELLPVLRRACAGEA